MKRCIIFIFVIVFVFGLSACNKEPVSGTTVFYGKESVLTNEDASDLYDLFTGRILYHDNPSCGFGEEVSVSFNDGERTFYVAMDTCPIIYDKNNDKYFSISESEQERLYAILEKYGFSFPCV